MDRRIVYNRIKMVVLSLIVYFCCDYFIQITGFLKFESFLGLKSFLPVTLALIFGFYGIIGEIIACIITSILLFTSYKYVIAEFVIIIVAGLTSWYLWHFQSETHKLHFRRIRNYYRYLIILLIAFGISSLIICLITNENHFVNVMVWGLSLSIIIGIPIDIIYSGLMCLNPVLPPIKNNGKRIEIKDDVREFVYDDPTTLGALNEKLEMLFEKENVPMKRQFEIQSCIEEIYLRILDKNKDAKIDVRASYDITFSVEFMYIGKKYNPFYITKGEDLTDIAGLILIKHRALLASYNYGFGENQIHVVI